MAKLTRSRLFAYLALLGNSALWALAIPFVKKGFQDGLTPLSFLYNRFLIAALLTLPIFFLSKNTPSGQKTLKPKRLIYIIPLELLFSVVSLLLLYVGLDATSAVEATLIAVTWPLFITLGAIIFLKEREEGHEWKGLLLAVLGTILLVIRPLFNHGAHGSTYGNLLILLQNVGLAAYFLLSKRLYRGLNKWLITSVNFFAAFIAFSLIAIFLDLSPLQLTVSLFYFSSPWPLIATLYMALPGSILAITLYHLGQEKIEASEASLFTYLQPLFSLPVAFLLLKESVGIIEIGALAIILIGIFLAEKR